MKTSQRKRLEELAYREARQLENDGQQDLAVKGYRAMLKKNPLHLEATARLLILYRKMAQTELEVQLLETALNSHNIHNAGEKKKWLADHSQLVKDSKALANLLGIEESAVLPSPVQEILAKWQLRLQRLKQKMIRDQQLSKKITAKKKKPALK